MHRDPLMHRVQVRSIDTVDRAMESANRDVNPPVPSKPVNSLEVSRRQELQRMQLESMLGHSSVGGVDVNSMLG